MDKIVKLDSVLSKCRCTYRGECFATGANCCEKCGDYKADYYDLKRLEEEAKPSQRYVVNGINNDKINLETNYDVRKLNRLIEATKAFNNTKWRQKLEQAKKDIRELGWFDEDDNCIMFKQVYVGDVFDILDKLIEGDNND